MKKKMPNRFYLTYTTRNPERGCEVMDWLVENDIEHTITLEHGGYFFGIDGAGYDFYEAHWIPLYEARGLEWHKTD